MEIYTFDKSLQERLVEFTEILSSRGDIVPASQIQSEWSYYIELVIEPVGWQALWKIPRLVCEDFQIHYPTIVVVEVEHVDFSELSALAKIIAVQDEIHLPEKYDIPLIELYPTNKQENLALDMVGTANCVDQLRFFFNHLWMPWDIDDDDNSHWVALHLETRIRLFFDMKRGLVNKETCDIIRTLGREGREIQEKISRLEATISDEHDVQDELLDDGQACQLMQLHFRLQQIKTEVEVLENPAMRDMLARNQCSSLSIGEKKRNDSSKRIEGHFVWLGGSLQQMREAFDKMQSFLPDDLILKTSGSLQESLHASDPGDIIIVSEGQHAIRGIGGLEEGGVIKGIHKSEHTILSPKETGSGPALLDFSGNEVLLENVSVNLGELQVGIIVRKGITKISGCKVYVKNESIVKLGVVVLPDAKLMLENTVFEGLGTALVIYATGQVTMNDCSFKNCTDGIQLQDNAILTAKKCSVSHLKDYGIRLETQKHLQGSESKIGSLELLNNVTEISINNCTFEGNGKGDVALKPKIAAALMTKQDTIMSSDL